MNTSRYSNTPVIQDEQGKFGFEIHSSYSASRLVALLNTLEHSIDSLHKQVDLQRTEIEGKDRSIRLLQENNLRLLKQCENVEFEKIRIDWESLKYKGGKKGVR